MTSALYSDSGDPSAEALLGRKVLIGKALDQLACRRDVVQHTDALTPAPLPCLDFGTAFRAAEIHVGRVSTWHVLRIHAGGDDGRAKVVTPNAREEVGVDDVFSTAFDDCLLVLEGSAE